LSTVVDTSVWSFSLRRKPADLNQTERAIVNELTQLIAEDEVRLLGIVRQEILSGIRAPAQFEKLRSVLRAFPDTEVGLPDYESAAQTSNQFQTKGITISVVDALICAVALNRDWTIFTTDSDFKRFAKSLSIRLHAPRK
jgi:predicted nucleic acid-binding protein